MRTSLIETQPSPFLPTLEGVHKLPVSQTKRGEPQQGGRKKRSSKSLEIARQVSQASTLPRSGTKSMAPKQHSTQVSHDQKGEHNHVHSRQVTPRVAGRVKHSFRHTQSEIAALTRLQPHDPRGLKTRLRTRNACKIACKLEGSHRPHPRGSTHPSTLMPITVPIGSGPSPTSMTSMGSLSPPCPSASFKGHHATSQQ